jgi:hypothetical protein
VLLVLAALVAGGVLAGGDEEVVVAAGAGAEVRRATIEERGAHERPEARRSVVPLAVEARMPAGARTVVDRRHRVRLRLPAGWGRATERATDRVTPMEGDVLAVATFPIRPRPQDACSEDVSEPRVAVGPADALVVVEEDLRAQAAGARERPRLRLLQQVAPPEPSRRARTAVFPSWGCRNEVGVSGLWETSFAQGGRVFSVAAIVGPAATDRTRSEALAVLESFRPVGARG